MASVSRAEHSPLMIIASRRQIDHAPDGGGYVEGWDTDRFAKAVRTQDQEGLLLLCRDHGGPWQQPNRVAARPEREMEYAKESLQRDVDAHFDLLHIDTSKSATGSASFEDAVSRLISLYSQINRYADYCDQDTQFEIGFEVQSNEPNIPSSFERQLTSVLSRIAKEGLKKPMFVVAQTGTKVVEDKNTGAVTRRDADEALDRVSELARVCRAHGVRLKAHNADYLTSAQVRALMDAGVGAINIAPQLGTLESTMILDSLDELGSADLAQVFVEAALRDGRWKSWVVPGKAYEERTLAKLGGHYIFATREVRDMRQELNCRREAVGLGPLEVEISESLVGLIRRYWYDTNQPAHQEKEHTIA
jgi:tagatose-1,6-bisphosphate aldolase non-catalytic subunit AgaZ/GatZ